MDSVVLFSIKPTAILRSAAPAERSALPGVNSAPVADLYDGYLENARETINKKIATTKDYRSALSRKDIDAVVVSTPDHWHTRIALDALSAKKDISPRQPGALNFGIQD